MCQHSSVKANVKRDYLFTCQWCFEIYNKTDAKALNVHHVLPEEDGGLTVPENLKPLCFETCHLEVHQHGHGITLNELNEVILIIITPPAIIIPLSSLPRQEDRILTLAA